MPMFQDARIHSLTGVEYRYEAEYAESSGKAVWRAAVWRAASLRGRRPHNLTGVVEFDTNATAACSAVARCVRSRIDETDFMLAEVS
jgi:hypothetical protein